MAGKPQSEEQAQTADAQSMAEQALADAAGAVDSLAGEVAGDEPPLTGNNIDLPNFQQVLADVEATGINLLHDVELNVKVELGRTNMLVEDVLRLSEGSVVELDKLAGDPVDIWVNERLVARGEVLVLNDCFCVRISEILCEVDQQEETDDGEPTAMVADTDDKQTD
jgi:flagellar motor switch protein FliN/FliY